jgi:hypothetical protein
MIWPALVVAALVLWGVYAEERVATLARDIRTLSVVGDAPSTTVAEAGGAAWLRVRLEGEEGEVTPAGTRGLVGRSRESCARAPFTRLALGRHRIRNATSDAVPFRAVDESGTAIVPAGPIDLLYELALNPARLAIGGRTVCLYEERVLRSGETASLMGCVSDRPAGRVVAPCGNVPIVLAPSREAAVADHVTSATGSLIFLAIPVPLLLLLATVLGSAGIESRRRGR